MKRVKAWHFLPDSGCLANSDGCKVQVGETYTVEGEIKLCSKGLHGSKRLIDALKYAHGNMLEKVEIWGDLQMDGDKLVGQNRKCLALIDVTKTLHEAACYFAERALKIAKVTDKRYWNVIKVKRLWLKGKASDKELVTARDDASAVRNVDRTTRGADGAVGVLRAAWDAASATRNVDRAVRTAREAASAARDTARVVRAVAGDAWEAEEKYQNSYLMKKIKTELIERKQGGRDENIRGNQKYRNHS